MEQLFNHNGLVFWSEDEIRLRTHMMHSFAYRLEHILWRENPAWKFVRIEAPMLTPNELCNPNYTEDDVYRVGDLTLRPETTPGSYVYAQHLLNTHSGHKAPLCVWQAGKSFRREQDQVTKNMRLKEFWQQEFQCIYAADTMNDYHNAVLAPLAVLIEDHTESETRVVASDRLPSYSQITMDIECRNQDRWIEVCSVSRRIDFPEKLHFQGKKGLVEKDALVLEVAIGLDRCVYCWTTRS